MTALVHVTCDECQAEQKLPASQVTVTADTYTFTCPHCRAHVTKPAERRTIDLLREAGCPARPAWCDELDDPAHTCFPPITPEHVDLWLDLLNDPDAFEMLLAIEGLTP